MKKQNKTIATVKINNSISGYVLVPLDENGEKAVARLYAFDTYEEFRKQPISEIAYMKGETVEAFTEHVKEIAYGLGYTVSVCGSKKNPTLRLWSAPGPVVPEEIDVDLKWSAWSCDQGYWDEYAPGAWQRMKDAWEGKAGPVLVCTAPRKEDRFAKVEIGCRKVSGLFYSNWDEIWDLACTLDLIDENNNWKTPGWERPGDISQQQVNDDMEMCFRESVPFSMYTWEPGNDVEFALKNARRYFQKMMDYVDEFEGELMEKDKNDWNTLVTIYAEDKPGQKDQ